MKEQREISFKDFFNKIFELSSGETKSDTNDGLKHGWGDLWKKKNSTTCVLVSRSCQLLKLSFSFLTVTTCLSFRCRTWKLQWRMRVSNSPESFVMLHWETGGPNISMVSKTSDRWSRNEFTDTLRIRASSALHLLKHSDAEVKKTATYIQYAARKVWSMCSVSYTDSVLPDTESSLLMPPFLGSRSGDRERRAMTASRDEGKGTSRELQDSQG